MPEPELGVPKGEARRLFWLVCVVVLAFLLGMVVDIALQQRRWWDPGPTRDERVLGDATDGADRCPAVSWESLTAGSEAFDFTGVTPSDAGSFEHVGGCEVHFDVSLGGEAAGEAVVEVEALSGFPRDLPWGAPMSRGCTRVFHATEDLFDQIIAADPAILPEDDACRVSADPLAGGASATIWAVRAYGDYRDYIEISLIDLATGTGDAAARAEAFSEFFADEFTEVVNPHLPSQQ